MFITSKAILPYALAMGATFMLSGCAGNNQDSARQSCCRLQNLEEMSAGVFEYDQEQDRKACHKLQDSKEMNECLKRWQSRTTYEEYNKQRERLLQEPSAAPSPDANKPMNCYRRTATAEVTCSN